MGQVSVRNGELRRPTKVKGRLQNVELVTWWMKELSWGERKEEGGHRTSWEQVVIDIDFTIGRRIGGGRVVWGGKADVGRSVFLGAWKHGEG